MRKIGVWVRIGLCKSWARTTDSKKTYGHFSVDVVDLVSASEQLPLSTVSQDERGAVASCSHMREEPRMTTVQTRGELSPCQGFRQPGLDLVARRASCNYWVPLEARHTGTPPMQSNLVWRLRAERPKRTRRFSLRKGVGRHHLLSTRSNSSALTKRRNLLKPSPDQIRSRRSDVSLPAA
jgi:hypothetical protein